MVGKVAAGSEAGKVCVQQVQPCACVHGTGVMGSDNSAYSRAE